MRGPERAAAISTVKTEHVVEQIIFADGWQAKFAESGFTGFDDFFQFSDGRPINELSRRSVQMLTLNIDSEQKTFFIKRFINPHIKDIIFARAHFGKFYSQAECEWENAKLLFANGIKTYRPLCLGSQKILGIEKNSFLVTEKLPGQPFSEFVAQNWTNLSQSQKENILTSIAKLIRKAHDAKIGITDLYIWHIFINQIQTNDVNPEYDFAVIDLHRMCHNVTNPNQLIQNLGRFHHSLRAEYFDENLKQFFIKAYAADNYAGEANKLYEQVKNYSKKLSAKRNQKPYLHA